MHPLHDDIARLLAERLNARSIVVWYDTRSEFAPFMDEVRGEPANGASITPVIIGGSPTSLIQFAGSMFEVRAIVEPLVSRDVPDRVVVYLPGCEPDATGSVLMEIEKAGVRWELQLKRVARDVLRRRFTDGDIDALLAPQGVTYEDLARASSDTSQAPSLLKGIFHEASGSDAILATWLAHDNRDEAVEAKDAKPELARLITSRLGLELADTSSSAKMRAAALRYVLGGEFRSDLTGDPPASLSAVPMPRNKEDEAAIREMARRLRTSFPDSYEELADRVEGELHLSNASVEPESLGTVDTFRFEERALLKEGAELIVKSDFGAALRLIAQREQCFWLDRDVARRAQWEACRLMAELGNVAAEIRSEVDAVSGNADDWIARYTTPGGWLRLDQSQRRMETFVAKLDDDPPERALALVRGAYEDACQAMADGFTKALAKSGWTAPSSLHQTQVHQRVVAEEPKPVAYFLVDALRYEMGADLVGRLPKTAEIRLQGAVASLPSLTPIGMAALQPGAAASFDVVDQGGKLGAQIEKTFLPDLAARRTFAAARIPHLIDLTLGDVLAWSKAKLAGQVRGAEVVMVRSQEIDLAGEAGIGHARQVMDSVIDDIVRAVRRLADAGIGHAVIAADHGHLFVHDSLDEAMRIDSPGGATVGIHRRCWIGRGGTTPAGCVRLTAAELGYASDLEFVFPRGAGVFKSGGDLGYHHGGPSLQEIVVPVITVHSAPILAQAGKAEHLEALNVPSIITNRIFTVTLELGGKNLALFSTPKAVQPVLLWGNKQVGTVGMAIEGDLDVAAGTVNMLPAKPVTVAFLLSDDSAESVRIVIRDPATDTELYRSPAEIPVNLGVA